MVHPPSASPDKPRNGGRPSSMFTQQAGIRPQDGQSIVLIADDDPIARNLARLILESEGYFVLAANDGLEAIAISRKCCAPIHVLLTDVQMPNMNGTELRTQMLVERPRTRVVLMSANDSPIPNVPFIRKPFERANLVELLHGVLASAE